MSRLAFGISMAGFRGTVISPYQAVIPAQGIVIPEYNTVIPAQAGIQFPAVMLSQYSINNHRPCCI